jgi:hypothetical protein
VGEIFEISEERKTPQGNSFQVVNPDCAVTPLSISNGDDVVHATYEFAIMSRP